MSVDYINQANGGWMTRDYTMDPADLASMNVTGQNRYGLPIVNGSSFDTATRGYVPTAAHPTFPFSGPANPRYAGVAAPQGNAAGNIVPLPGAMPVPTEQIQPNSDQDRYQLQANNQELQRLATWGRAPVNGAIDATHLATAQRTRAAWIPGGADLLDQLTGGNPTALNVTDGDVSSNPFITGAEGKKPLGSNRLNLDLINDPRFRMLHANNPDNASRFYEAITGRSLKGDTDAQVAQLTAQRAVQDKQAAEVGMALSVADKDDQNTGVKKGDFVKRQTLPGLLPGTVTSANVPLTLAEKQLVGIGLDGKIQGNSIFHRATGLYGNVDVEALGQERDRLMAASAADDASRMASARSARYAPQGGRVVPFDSPMYDGPSPMRRDFSAASSMMGNMLNTTGRVLHNSATGVMNYLTGHPGNYYGNNAAYLEAMAAREAALRAQYGDNYDATY